MTVSARKTGVVSNSSVLLCFFAHKCDFISMLCTAAIIQHGAAKRKPADFMEPLRAGNARPYGFDRAAGGERRGDHWSPVPAAAVVGADDPVRPKAPLDCIKGSWRAAPEGIKATVFPLYFVRVCRGRCPHWPVPAAAESPPLRRGGLLASINRPRKGFRGRISAYFMSSR